MLARKKCRYTQFSATTRGLNPLAVALNTTFDQQATYYRNLTLSNPQNTCITLVTYHQHCTILPEHSRAVRDGVRGPVARDAALRAGGRLLPRRGVHLLRQQVHAQTGAVRRTARALR